MRSQEHSIIGLAIILFGSTCLYAVAQQPSRDTPGKPERPLQRVSTLSDLAPRTADEIALAHHFRLKGWPLESLIGTDLAVFSTPESSGVSSVDSAAGALLHLYCQ